MRLLRSWRAYRAYPLPNCLQSFGGYPSNRTAAQTCGILVYDEGKGSVLRYNILSFGTSGSLTF